MDSNWPLLEETANMSQKDLEKRFKAVGLQMREHLMKETLTITNTAVVAAEEVAEEVAQAAASASNALNAT